MSNDQDKLKRIRNTDIAIARIDTNICFIKQAIQETKDTDTKQWEKINQNTTDIAVVKSEASTFAKVWTIFLNGGFLIINFILKKW